MPLINDFLSLIFPKQCLSCKNSMYGHEQFICNHCKAGLERSNYHRKLESPMISLFAGRIPLEHATALFLFEKEGKVQNLIHSIKYNGNKELAYYLGQLFARELIQDKALSDIQIFIPIPLHNKKLKARGFNQSEYFANGMASVFGKEVNTRSLFRSKETETQTKKKRFERWENVSGVFEVNDLDALENKHVLLVDDVITTGATLEAAAQSLMQVKGLRLSVASLAFAPKN